MADDDFHNQPIDAEQLRRHLEAMAPPEHPSMALEIAPKLEKFISSLDWLQAVQSISGLLCEPSLQANLLRIDWGLRMVVGRAAGTRKLNKRRAIELFNELMPTARVERLEDPIEGFCIDTVLTSYGDRFVMEGLWPNGAIETENALNAFSRLPDHEIKQKALNACDSLLRLSSELAGRVGHPVGTLGSGQYHQPLNFPQEKIFDKWATRTFFSRDDIASLGIPRDALEPFFLPLDQRATVLHARVGNSILEFRPLIEQEGGVLLAAPTNITTAVRALLIDTAIKGGFSKTLAAGIMDAQKDLIEQSSFCKLEGPRQQIASQCFIRQSLYRLSERRYIHFVQCGDLFEDWPQKAFSFGDKYASSVGDAVSDGIKVVQQRLAKESGNPKCITILITGNWGSFREISFPRNPHLEDWDILPLEPAAAATLGGCEDGSLEDIWRLNEMWRFASTVGFDFHFINGILNLFQWWRDNEFELVPPYEVSLRPPLLINFDLDRHLKALIEARSALGRLTLERPDGSYFPMRRLEHKTHDDRLEPIYGSFEAIKNGTLVGAVAAYGATFWIELSRDSVITKKMLDYEAWRAALQWTLRFLPELFLTYPQTHRVLLVKLQIDSEASALQTGHLSDEEILELLDVRLTGVGEAEVRMDARWHIGLYRPDNFAEVALAACLIRAAGLISNIAITEAESVKIARTAAGSPDYRWRHLFEADSTADRLSALGLVGEFRRISHSAAALAKQGKGWSARDRDAGPNIVGKAECIEFFTALASLVFDNLRTSVSVFDRRSLISACLAHLQAAIYEQDHWKHTARAMRAIYGIERDHQISLESATAVNGVIRGATIIAELAQCEAKIDSGLSHGKMDTDELFASATMYFLMMDTLAAIHGDGMTPELRLSPMGDVQFDHFFEERTIKHSAAAHNVKDRAEASNMYVSRFEADEPRRTPSADFLNAVAAEYSANAQNVVNFPYAVTNVCKERGTGVLNLRLSELREALREQTEFADVSFENLIKRLILSPRKGWEDYPAGFQRKHYDLSRFDRPQSLIGRPIVALDNSDDPELLVAPAVVERALRHNFGGADTGTLQNEFWTSAEMQNFASDRGRRAGLEFNLEVAAQLEKYGMRSWPSASPSWVLNRKNTDELKRLGDVDVLAISNDGSMLWVVEAKDLKLCRTLGEAVRRLSSYRGLVDPKGRPDKMSRHLERVEFFRKNLSGVTGRLGLSVIPRRVCGAMIVNAPQPMEIFSTKNQDGTVVMLEKASAVPWATGWN